MVGLQIGQLVKDDHFTLFESVQALEIMDPKMDSGILLPGDTLDSDYDLLCFETAWHQGWPLSQTLFTSLHIDNLLSHNQTHNNVPLFPPTKVSLPPSDILQIVLRAYCFGVVKSCDMVIELIVSQHYYEDEDFVSQTYNRGLLTDVPDDTCVDMLVSACEWVEAQEKVIGQEVAHAIIDRLKSKQEFLQAFLPPRPDEPAEARWFQLEARLQDIKVSHAIAKPVQAAFSAKVQRRLASTAPPRPIKDLAFDDACHYLEKMCKDVRAALQANHLSANAGLSPVVNFLWSVNSSQTDLSIFARCVLQAYVLGEDKVAGAWYIKDAILADLDMAMPADMYLDVEFWEVELPTDVRFRIARKVDSFTEQAESLITSMLRALCQNQCRIRRSLINLLETLQDLPSSSEPRNVGDDSREDLEISLDVVANAIAGYSRRLILNVSQWIVQLGFEQDLYQPFELANLYWYASTLCKERADSLLALQDYPSEVQQDRSRSSKHDMELLQCSVIQKIMLGLSLIFAFLNRGMLILHKVPAYGSRELQHELRMRPFPDAPSCAEMTEAAERPGRPVTTLLTAADAAFDSIRRDLQSLLKSQGLLDGHAKAKATGMLRFSVMARITVRELFDAVKKAELCKVDMATMFDVDVSAPEKGAWWNLPKIKAR